MDQQGRKHIGRELAGAAMLLVLLAVGLLTSWHMGRTHSEISGKLDDAAWFALSGNWQDAGETAAAARAQWQSQWKLSAVLADHSKMEQADALFARLTVHTAARQREEFAAVCAELSRYVRAMGDAHSLSWWNLL